MRMQSVFAVYQTKNKAAKPIKKERTRRTKAWARKGADWLEAARSR
jgi:hypothetical protein